MSKTRVKTIVFGNQINYFPSHIKFKVNGSSIMEFQDWVQVEEKTLDLYMAKKVSQEITFARHKNGQRFMYYRNNCLFIHMQ